METTTTTLLIEPSFPAKVRAALSDAYLGAVQDMALSGRSYAERMKYEVAHQAYQRMSDEQRSEHERFLDALAGHVARRLSSQP